MLYSATAVILTEACVTACKHSWLSSPPWSVEHPRLLLLLSHGSEVKLTMAHAVAASDVSRASLCTPCDQAPSDLNVRGKPTIGCIRGEMQTHSLFIQTTHDSSHLRQAGRGCLRYIPSYFCNRSTRSSQISLNHDMLRVTDLSPH